MVEEGKGVKPTGPPPNLQKKARPVVLTDALSRAVSEELQVIEGRIKTFIEAITDDEAQCKARKDTVSNLIWQTTRYLFDYIQQETK